MILKKLFDKNGVFLADVYGTTIEITVSLPIQCLLLVPYFYCPEP